MDPKDQKIKDLEEKIKALETGKETDKLRADLDHAKKELEREQNAHKATKEEFSAYKQNLEEKALQDRVDALAEDGRIKASDKQKALAFAKVLPGEKETMDFSKPDGTTEKITPREMYLRDLEARKPDQDGLLSEFAQADHAGPGNDTGDAFQDINDYA